ncbi:MAG: hypothetical protein DRO67_01345 [Candidatus Asgardarchaeum californiense]|nr:MAG: hypothetical protein DRO67_01345 [Candidatus Asgardarchaeum californiense]
MCFYEKIGKYPLNYSRLFIIGFVYSLGNAFRIVGTVLSLTKDVLFEVDFWLVFLQYLFYFFGMLFLSILFYKLLGMIKNAIIAHLMNFTIVFIVGILSNIHRIITVWDTIGFLFAITLISSVMYALWIIVASVFTALFEKIDEIEHSKKETVIPDT